jgi:hypothetical protein
LTVFSKKLCIRKSRYINFEKQSYFRYEAIVPGKPEFIGEYMEKYWYCESEEKLMKFLK